MRTHILCGFAFIGSIFIFFVGCSKSGNGSGSYGGATGGGTTTTTSTVSVSTLANASVFNPGPTGIALGAQGNIYVSSNNYLIYKVTSVGSVSNFVGKPGTAGCGNGVGDTAMFTDPVAICTDAQGNIYVADNGCMSIKKVSPGAVATTFITTNQANNITIDGPQAIAIDPQGNIYSADPMGQDGITMVTPGGTGSHLAGTSTSGYRDGPAASAEFLSPTGLAADGQGNVYVADTDNNRIRMVTPAGVPTNLCIDGQGNLYTADFGSGLIRKITFN